MFTCFSFCHFQSVEFHERGKRHKENVQKKIDELRKRSGEKAKEQEELDAGMAHIERVW